MRFNMLRSTIEPEEQKKMKNSGEIKLKRSLHGNGSSTEKLNLLRQRYAKCISIKKELVDAVKQYRHDAEQGDAEAQYHLGCCYQFGDGIIKNKVEAAKWLRKAARQGYGQARGLLEIIKHQK